jgi:hypothetical protein
MKIIVGSYTNFDGVGHTTRIACILDVLQQLYGANNIEWINVLPERKRIISSFFKNKETYKTNKYKTTFFPFLSYPIIKFLFSWTCAVLILFYLILKYGTGKDLILWIEMSSSAWPFLLYKSLFNVPFILDIHGTIDERIQFTQKTTKTIYTYAESIFDELMAISKSDVVIGVSNKMIEVYRSRYHSLAKHCFVLPVFTPCQKDHWSESSRALIRQELGIENSCVFVYSGGIQPWQCVPDILLFFKKIITTDILKSLNPTLLLLIWDKQNQVSKWIEEIDLPLDKVIVKSIPQNEVMEYLSAADVGLLFRENLTTNLVSSPTKAAEYLNSGLPILSTPYVGDIPDLIQKENVGFIIDIWKEMDLDALSGWCTNIYEHREEFAQRSIATGQQYFSNRDINQKVQDIVNRCLTLSD